MIVSLHSVQTLRNKKDEAKSSREYTSMGYLVTNVLSSFFTIFSKIIYSVLFLEIINFTNIGVTGFLLGSAAISGSGRVRIGGLSQDACIETLLILF